MDEIFNRRSITQLAEALRGIIPMGDTRLSTHQLRRSLQDRWYDTSKIRRETGWQPRVALPDAVQRTLTGARPFTVPEAVGQQR